jgi:hypothetical protein
VEYRFNGLDPAAAYRVGIVTYDDKDQRRFDLVLMSSSGRPEFVLAKGAAVPSASRGEPPRVLWFDVPAGTVDPGGAIVALRCAGGANATLAELWLVRCR